VDKVAHTLGPEALGEGGGVDDVAKEDGTLASSRREACSPSPVVAGFGTSRFVAVCAGSSERAALPAEFMLGRVCSRRMDGQLENQRCARTARRNFMPAGLSALHRGAPHNGPTRPLIARTAFLR